MKSFYSCAELAEMKIQGLPLSKPGIKLRAEKEGWQSREVAAKGGKGGIKTEYQPPKKVLDLIKKHSLGQALEAVKQPLIEPEKSTDLTLAKVNVSELKDWQRSTAEALSLIHI